MLGETVKRIRKSRNMSQKTFAKSLGYKFATTINKKLMTWVMMQLSG